MNSFKEDTMANNYSYDREEKEIPAAKLSTNRNIWKLLILNFLTCGVYGIIFFIPFSFDLDKIAPKPDRSKTMNYLIAYVLSLFTFSIVLAVWFYHITERVEEALGKRNINYEFGTNTFWGWYVFGSLIYIGPFVYLYKLCKAMNLLCADYNERPVIEE